MGVLDHAASALCPEPVIAIDLSKWEAKI